VIGVDIKAPWPSGNKEMADRNHWYHKLHGGIFGEILPHTIYLAMEFLGRVEPVAVHARKLTRFDFIDSDELRVILDAENGVGTVTISCSWNKNKLLVDLRYKKVFTSRCDKFGDD
jgi:predicted dehydrogenase